MSADVSINNDHFNYTHNLNRLWYDHIPDTGKGGGLKEIDELTGNQALPILVECFARLDETRRNLYVVDAIGEPGFSARYDAPNGWGSAIGGIIFLARIMGACAQNRRHKIRVSL